MTTPATLSTTAAAEEITTPTPTQPETFSQQPQSTPPPSTATTTTTTSPSAILTSNDGTFRLDLTSFNLSPQDLATITSAFNATINSSTTFISTASSSTFSSPPTTSTNNVSSSFNTSSITTTTTAASSSTTATPSSKEYVMKRTPKARRPRAKHSIVPEEILIAPENVPGTFLNLSQKEFDEMVNDNESALTFAAKVGLIQNVRKCPKCERDMALCKFNNSCGYRWVCRRTESSKRFTCSVRGMKKDTILDDRLVGILTMLRIMYHFSKNVSDDEIIKCLDIGHVRSARTILSRLREMVDAEVSKLSTDSLLTAEELRQHFLLSEGIDHFGMDFLRGILILIDFIGFILFWGTRYKPEKSSTPSDEKPSCINNNNATQNSNISDPPPFVIKEEDPIAESMDVAEKEVEEEAPLPPPSENVVKNEAESESSFTCSTAKEEEEKEEKEETKEYNYNSVFDLKQELMLSESSSSDDSSDSDSD